MLIDWYRNDQRYKKNILRLSGFQYEFKNMQAGINQMLSFMSPGQLALRPETVTELKDSGYDMDAWFKGELLAVNGKLPMNKWGSTASKLFGNGSTSVA